MGRRLVLSSAALILGLCLLAPGAQAAGKYVVKDKAGRKAGSATSYSRSQGVIWNTSGHREGAVAGQLDGDTLGWFVLRQDFTDIVGSASRYSAKVFRVRDASAARALGRAVLAGSRWRLQKKVAGSWHTRGSVSSKLHGATAAGALRLLLW